MHRLATIATLGLIACSAPMSPPDAGGPAPNAGHFTLECAPHGLGALDSARSVIPGVRATCTAHVADRLGAPLAGVAVQFLAEAGRVRAQAPSTAQGIAAAEYQTSLPLPLDVDPDTFSNTPLNDATHTGQLLAPAWMEPHHWVENPPVLLTAPPSMRTYTLAEPRRPDPIRLKPDGSGRAVNNPRDNLVTLIAVVTGDEAFVDDNANGDWDPGESFEDLTEPFVDANDNGTRDTGEPFIDSDQNGRWDGKNGTWDEATSVWAQERILWTGVPALEDQLDVVPGVPGHRKTVTLVLPSGVLALACDPFVSTCAEAGSPSPQSPTGRTPTLMVAYVADPWFNTIAREAASDGCTSRTPLESPAVVRILELSPGPGVGPRSTWPAGEEIAWKVGDVRDPSMPTPARNPPVSFQRTIECQYTTQPAAAAQRVNLPFTGTIQ